MFYEQLMIDFETVFYFLDPLDPKYCKIIRIIYKFSKSLLLILIELMKYEFFFRKNSFFLFFYFWFLKILEFRI